MSTLQQGKPFLGRYELQKKIAVGGMAELYLAQVRGVGGFQKQVVVKRILPQLAESEELFNMFLDEARIAATLQHPNVVQVYDSCQEDGEYFMAMEYLDGTDLRTLRKVLADKALPLPWEHALHIVTSISAGLHYAHDKRGLDNTPLGIVHRDVTPHNIFLTREGGVKLVDFGIAKAQGRATETALGTLKGKLAYMSPEQCKGEDIDRRSDLYSLGVILYELTTGRRLYKGTTEYELIKEIVEGEITPPSDFMEYPKGLESIVLKCLKKSPDARYATARDVQSALEGFAREHHVMSSALGFSTFLEPLLSAAAEAAEKRWKHRLAEGAPARGVAFAKATPPPASAPAPSAAPVAKPRTMSAPLPRPSTTPHPDSYSAIPSLPSLIASGSVDSGPVDANPLFQESKTRVGKVPTPDEAMFGEEEMTVRVPTDTLERIRAEERELLEQEKAAESDAIPRMARGTGSGEHSVSAHVVSRESSKIVINHSDIFAAKEEVEDDEGEVINLEMESIDLEMEDETAVAAPLPEPAAPEAEDSARPSSVRRAFSTTAVVPKAHFTAVAKDIAAAKDSKKGTKNSSDSSQDARDRAASERAHSAARSSARAASAARAASERLASEVAVATPLASEDFEEALAKKSSGKALWLAGAAIAALAAGGLYVAFGGSATRKPAASSVASAPAPTTGTLAVSGAPGADVWLFLGRTPVDQEVPAGLAGRRVRIEHEGYHSDERVLADSTFSREADGRLLATANFELKSDGDEAPEAPAVVASAGELPTHLRLSSTPSSAKAWIYVGTTPNVRLEGLALDRATEIRVEQDGAPPSYRVLRAADYDGEGVATITVEAVETPEAEAPIEAEPADEAKKAPAPAKASQPTTASQGEAPKKPARTWRPRKGGPLGKPAAAKKPLKGPTPTWAK